MKSASEHITVGPVLNKYLERMNKANDQLLKLARDRKRRVAVDLVQIKGMNHFLVTDKNDKRSENFEPVNIAINQDLTLSITNWLNDLWLRPGN